jgi:hypothetical protein
MMGKIGGALLLVLVLICSPAFGAEKRWVSSQGTQLKAEASVSSESVADLAVGAELVVVEASGRWMKVRSAEGKEGYVYAGKVSEEPPAAEVTGDGGLFGATMDKSQINTAKADSARSIRGLSPEITQYARQRGTGEAFRKELDKILSRKVSDNELKAFLREGKIGEYAQ